MRLRNFKVTNRFKEIKKELKKLNGLQWTKKQALKRVISNNAGCQRNINRNMIVDPAGQKYAPWDVAKYLVSQCRQISELTKDLKERRWKINQLESELYMIKCHKSKNAYFENTNPNDYIIVGVHEAGFQEPGGPYMAEEIWANTYLRQEDGTLKMKGGSMRVQGPFEEVVDEYRKDPEWKEVPEVLK